MRFFPRAFCIVILGISIVLKSNEAPIHRTEENELSTKEDLPSQSNTRSEKKYLTASYIPPFLRNLYAKISQNAHLQKAQTSLQVYKGYFEETGVHKQDFLSFPSLYSDEFFNFTFGRAEIRIWYQCPTIASIQSPLYLELESSSFFGQEFRWKIQASCKLSDDANKPTPYGWAIFDVTDFLQTLRTTRSDHLKQELKFSIRTSSRLIRINKQHFANKFNPTHMPLLTFYHRHIIKYMDPGDVSMRFVASNGPRGGTGEELKRSVREVAQRNRYSPCSRITKTIKLKDILRIVRNRVYNYVYPTKVNFGYCEGYCPFRLINHHNGTAHSQFMNAIARRRHQPRYATCMPATYGDLFVLQSYTISNTPVTSIVKYRDAFVRSCGCR